LSGKTLLVFCVSHPKNILDDINHNPYLAKKLWSYITLQNHALWGDNSNITLLRNSNLLGAQDTLRRQFENNISGLIDQLISQAQPLTGYFIYSLIEQCGFFASVSEKKLEEIVDFQKLESIAEACPDRDLPYWFYCYYAKYFPDNVKVQLSWLEKALKNGSTKAWDFIIGKNAAALSPAFTEIYQKNIQHANSIFYKFGWFLAFSKPNLINANHIHSLLDVSFELYTSLGEQKRRRGSAEISQSSQAISLLMYKEFIQVKRGKQPNTNFYANHFFTFSDELFSIPQFFESAKSELKHYYSRVCEYYEKNKTPELALKLAELWPAFDGNDLTRLFNLLVYAAQSENKEALTLLETLKSDREYAAESMVCVALFKVYRAQKNNKLALQCLFEGCERKYNSEAIEAMRDYAKETKNINLLYKAYGYWPQKNPARPMHRDWEVIRMLESFTAIPIDKIQAEMSGIQFFHGQKKSALQRLQSSLKELTDGMKKEIRDNRLMESPYKRILTAIEAWENESVAGKTNTEVIATPSFELIKGMRFLGSKPKSADSTVSISQFIENFKTELRTKEAEFSHDEKNIHTQVDNNDNNNNNIPRF
nr:hypothetical protein [Gammaproteobacteria bacterium]